MVEEVVTKIEARVGQLIDEVKGLRDRSRELEEHNDALKATAADYDQAKARLEAAQARVADLEQAAASATATAEERDRLARELDEARARAEAADRGGDQSHPVSSSAAGSGGDALRVLRRAVRGAIPPGQPAEARSAPSTVNRRRRSRPGRPRPRLPPRA